MTIEPNNINDKVLIKLKKDVCIVSDKGSELLLIKDCIYEQVITDIRVNSKGELKYVFDFDITARDYNELVIGEESVMHKIGNNINKN